MKYGSKFIYQTMPRLLTIWLDLGEDRTLSKHDIYKKINMEVSRALKVVPVYKASSGTETNVPRFVF